MILRATAAAPAPAPAPATARPSGRRRRPRAGAAASTATTAAMGLGALALVLALGVAPVRQAEAFFAPSSSASRPQQQRPHASPCVLEAYRGGETYNAGGKSNKQAGGSSMDGGYGKGSGGSGGGGGGGALGAAGAAGRNSSSSGGAGGGGQDRFGFSSSSSSSSSGAGGPRGRDGSSNKPPSSSSSSLTSRLRSMEPRLLQAPGLPPYSSQSPSGRRNRNRYPSSSYKPSASYGSSKAPTDASVRLPPPTSSFSSSAFTDPFSLSPSSLAAAVHQLVKELTAQGPGPAHGGGGKGGGGGASGGDPKAQRKEWQRQKAMEQELMALLAAVESSLPFLPPEAVSTVINALSKLSPRGLRAVLPFPLKKPPPPTMHVTVAAAAASASGGAGAGSISHVANVFKSATTAAAAAAGGQDGGPDSATGRRPSASLLPALCLRALELANLLGPRCVATTINSLARLRSNVAPYSLPLPPALLPALATQAQRAFRVHSHNPTGSRGRRDEERFTPQGLSNVINGFARLGHVPPRRFLDAFCEEALLLAPDMGPQTLANVMNALGKLGYHPGHKFLEAMAARGQEILEHFNTQGLANLLNGFARLNPPFHPGPEFLERFKQVSYPDLPHFESRGLAALAHGFSTLGHHPGTAYLDALGEAMGRRLERATQGREGMTGWTLSTFYNGLARLDWRPGTGPIPGLWTEAATTAVSPGARADAAKADPDLSGMAWRLLDEIKAGPRLRELGELGAQTIMEIGDGPAVPDDDEIGQGSGGWGRGGGGGTGRRAARPTGARLWAATDEWLVAQGQGEHRWGDVLEPQQLTQLLWSLAAMGPPLEAEGLFRRLLGAAVARLGVHGSGSGSSDRPSSSGSVRGGRGSDKEEGEEGASGGVSLHAVRQLRQVARFAELVLGWEGVQAAVGAMPCTNADVAFEEPGQHAPEQPTSSSMLHMEVLRLMARDLRAHDARTEVDDGVYVQDIVLLPRQDARGGPRAWLPVIVEVDGPPHFFNNMPRRSRGDHRLKNRILRAQTGVSNGGVVSVTWWEWVSRTRTQRAKMLVRKMVEVGVLDPSVYLGGVAAVDWIEEEEPEQQLLGAGALLDEDDEEEEAAALALAGYEDDDEEWEDYWGEVDGDGGAKDLDAMLEALCLEHEQEQQAQQQAAMEAAAVQNDMEAAAAPSPICSKTQSLLQQKQARPQSKVTWFREQGRLVENNGASASSSKSSSSSSSRAGGSGSSNGVTRLPPSAATASAPAVEGEDAAEAALWSQTVLQLRDQLRARNLPVSGVKAQLVARLLGRAEDGLGLGEEEGDGEGDEEALADEQAAAA